MKSNEELLYVKGAKIWLPNPNTVWEGACLENDYKRGDAILKIATDSGQKFTLKLKSIDDLPPLRNPTILIGQNDLTALSYLHEPAVLHNLEIRFRQMQAIYTYCGIVLVAINPYADLPLYGSDIIRAYRGHSMGELEPHIFAVAEEAYTKLEREKCNLSIIVSGESGAGKTVSAKYAMRYFAAVGGSENETQIERKVLASSPIMEAIGNAKTTRNDNSSRFGKFTKLLFKNDMGMMILTGATMQTYLLEKSRVVFQAPGERNYHIFYQLCACRDQWPELLLENRDKFRYLNPGGCLDIEKVSDRDQFNETLNALNTLGFSTQEISDIMKILAGILHLGNIDIEQQKSKSKDIDQEACDISPNDLNMHIMSEILKIDSNELRKWIICRVIESGHDTVIIPNTTTIAETARDALAKHIYAKLFQYIVQSVNKTLICGRKQSFFIGVLDIYGFETFDTNSFEQFCINYANEKLQQQFNQHVFQLEQEEYLKEGIIWTMIDFYDNQPCIDLIESKLGILDLLDEECKMPRGSDESWADKLVSKCTKYKHFEKARFGTTSFLVKHFSDTVEYDVHGFLEKNRDTISKELVNVFRQSQMGLCKKIMELSDDTTAITDLEKKSSSTSISSGRVVISASKSHITPSKQHKQTVGSQFRDSLSALITTLHATTPHYVRCIKPNENKAAFKWEPGKIVQQLRACGVLETVRISAAGFPSRWLYSDFYNRYRLLCKSNEINKSSIKISCENIIKKWIHDEDKYRFGNTQIFFRAGQVAYLEQLRANIRRDYIIRVQAIVRRFIYMRKYQNLKRIVKGIQRYALGYLARKKFKETRENRAAIKIQACVRGWLCRRRYMKMKHAVAEIQKYARGYLTRIRFKIILNNHRAIQIQRFCRGYLARVAYKKKIANIIKCQAVVRGFLARRLYKRMKAEARTISHIQRKYKGLENKIITLQQKIDELNKENTVLKHKTHELADLKQKLDAKKNTENELRSLKAQLDDKERIIVNVVKQFENERDEKMSLLEEKNRIEALWNEQKQIWRIEKDELKRQVDEMVDIAKKEEKVSSNRAVLISETDKDEIHLAYQRIIKEKEMLENENFLLKEELHRVQKMSPNTANIAGTHSRSISNASSQNEDDYGYSSAKNTLELRRTQTHHGHEHHTISPEPNLKSNVISTPKSNQTVLILKLRKILEEEKYKNEALICQVTRLKNKTGAVIATEDSLRASELEVECDRLRHDYDMLRNSISRGLENQEILAQFNALQEEVRRRREECIQLRAVLAEQSQSLKTLGAITHTGKSDLDRVQDNGDLSEAFQAQKLVNRQLESELKALTEENNARLAELTKQLEEIRYERNHLKNLFHESINNTDDNDIESLRKTISYLQHELEKSYVDYATLQEQVNDLTSKMGDLTRKNNLLTAKLRENGLLDTTIVRETTSNSLSNRRKGFRYEGIFEYRFEDIDKILQKLVVELSPRLAIGFLPGLPAYMIFMLIRYTDHMNDDANVKILFSKFVLHMKKIYRMPHTHSEVRVLWLINTLTLYNLLKQYGGIEEFMKFNNEYQNQQQLKNFDLSEYREVIYEIIINLHDVLIKQVQESIKPCIVPAILDHDEMARGRNSNHRGRALSLDASPEHRMVTEPKSLVRQLEHFHKQFSYFGLDPYYIEQIYTQLMYYICAISMNNLMLRGELCMWKTGMKIRYNISCLEDWVRKKKMAKEVIAPMTPLIQVSSLLQSRKSEEDVQSIFDLCSSLTTAQVLKIVKSYNPDDCENRISDVFIEKLTEKLNERSKNEQTDVFMMNENAVYHLNVVFKHSDIKLEEIELPPALEMENLLTKI